VPATSFADSTGPISLLQAAAVPATSFADSTGPIPGLLAT
jgi:hypothetical protein